VSESELNLYRDAGALVPAECWLEAIAHSCSKIPGEPDYTLARFVERRARELAGKA
jgi:hypothetical protein